MTLKPRCLGCGKEIELDAAEYRDYRGPVPCPCGFVTDMVFEDGYLLTSGTAPDEYPRQLSGRAIRGR